MSYEKNKITSKDVGYSELIKLAKRITVGRKPLDNNEKKSCELKTNVTTSEKDSFSLLAKDKKMTVSQLLRTIITEYLEKNKGDFK